MKILELHLRNIASIVKADIDFEKDTGMIDPDTGQAARMFLIFGDTGTGKSVLLDGIAMALFGKTPRTEGVVNRARNTFVSGSGSEINITSIEQYTRLGITEKDECYSEVVFAGNDGVDYRAKMELGVARMRNGNYKNRKKWTLKAGEQAPVEGEQCGKMIEAAVGMNFDQFNRLAMLAQGQFATFLCGGREERADILEKLTNTSIFSDYGRAIKNLYDKKKETSEKLKSAYEKAAEYVIPSEVLEQLKGQMADSETKEKTAAANRKTLSDKIALVTKAEESNSKITSAKTKLDELAAEMQSEEYATKRSLCKDWDDTDSIRKTMSDLMAGKEALVAIGKDEVRLKAEFESLTADLLWRNEAMDRRAASINQEKAWIKEREDKDALYSEAKVICARLEQYKRERGSLDALKREKSAAEQQVATLTEAVQKAENEKNQAESIVKATEAVIKKLTEQRDALEPAKLDEKQRELNRLKMAFEKLSTDYKALVQKRTERSEKAVRLQRLEQQRQEQEQLLEKAQAQAQANKKEYEKSLKRFSTINASLEETIETLRSKIAEEHTKICPLCGQTIEKPLLTRDDFSALVKPYYEEQKEAKAAADLSQEKLTTISNAFNVLKGELNTLTTGIQNDTASIDRQEAALKPRMEKASIAMDDDVEQTIANRIKEVETSEERLQQKRQQVNDLQQTINDKVKEKSPQDNTLRDSIQRFTEAKLNKSQNDKRIVELAEKTANMASDIKKMQLELGKQIGTTFPAWEDEVDTVAEKLRKEAEEYNSRKERLKSDTAALSQESEQLEQMKTVCDGIRERHSEWAVATIGRKLESGAIVQQWNGLSSRCSVVENEFKNCNESIARCENELAEWRRQSGKDDDYLVRLMAMREEIMVTRQYLTEKESDRKIWSKTLDDATADSDAARTALGLNDGDALPDRGELEDQRNAEEQAEKAANALYAEAKAKLTANKDFEAKEAEAKTAFEKAQKQTDHWSVLNKRFGGERFRNLVQTYILRPLLNNANMYLRQITERYSLTCSEENEQLSILVLDRFNRNEVRSAAVLSGGEKFMISLALSLALSSLNRSDMNVNILFIDEGFGTLDQECLSSVMSTLGRLSEMSGQGGRRVGIISHREELLGCIPNKIKLNKIGEGRSSVEVVYEP